MTLIHSRSRVLVDYPGRIHLGPTYVGYHLAGRRLMVRTPRVIGSLAAWWIKRRTVSDGIHRP